MTSRLQHMCVSDFKAGIGFMILFAMVSQVNSLLYKRFHLGRNGSFSSPNYPTSYPEEILYEWIFPVTPDSMSLDFIHMDLYLCYHVHEGKPSCDKYDHVTIEGYGTYCNWYKPTNIVLQPWTSTTITFRSFSFRKQCRGDGFKANYKTVLMTTKTPTRAPTDNPSTDSQRKANGTITIIIIIASITVSACIVSLVVWCVCCKCKTANQIPQAQQNQTAVICENENIDRGSTVHARHSELLSNNVRGFLGTSVPANADVGPPPSYNVACNDDQNNSFLEENLESPPSYENAMSGQTQLRRSQESLIQEVERSDPSSTTGLIDAARENENEISLTDSLESNTERNEIFV